MLVYKFTCVLSKGAKVKNPQNVSIPPYKSLFALFGGKSLSKFVEVTDPAVRSTRI